MTHAMCAAPYTTADIARLDRCLAGIVRRCLQLPPSFPTSAILRPESDGGWGVISLMADYAVSCNADLVRALSDKGRLGKVTAHLLNQQIESMGLAPVEELACDKSRYCTLLRAHKVLGMHNLTLMVRGKPFQIATPESSSKRAQAIWSLTKFLKETPVPLHMISRLHSLGIKHLIELMTPDGKSLIDTNALEQHWEGVTKGHKQALNRISFVVSKTRPSGIRSINSYNKIDALPPLNRRLPNELTLDLPEDENGKTVPLGEQQRGTSRVLTLKEVWARVVARPTTREATHGAEATLDDEPMYLNPSAPADAPAAPPQKKRKGGKRNEPLPVPQDMILSRCPPSHVREDQPAGMQAYWTNLRDVSRKLLKYKGTRPEANVQHAEFWAGVPEGRWVGGIQRNGAGL